MSRTLVPVLVVLIAQGAAGAGLAEMYSDAELARDKPRYEQRIGQLHSLGLREFMHGAEKQRLAGVRIEHPLKGASPLDAFSHVRDDIPRVVLPVLSLKFLEDLSAAYAWRHVHRHSLEPIDEYLAMLKYRRPDDFPGRLVPPPLVALGVAPDWQRDKRVDDLSLRFRNTAWAFILAHELGHLYFRHPGNQGVPPAVSQRNEMEADAWALELLSRSDTIPVGMILWFQATVGYFQNRADFPSEVEYHRWVESEATHPVNPERLQRLGIALNRAADATLSATHAEVLRFLAGQVVGIGDILADPDMQRLIARCAVLGSPHDLKRLHDRPCDQTLK